MTPRSAPVTQAAISDSSLNRNGTCDRAMPRPRMRAWKVLHACNAYETISAVVDAQSSSGMLPEVVTAHSPSVSIAGSLVRGGAVSDTGAARYGKTLEPQAARLCTRTAFPRAWQRSENSLWSFTK